ncbi:MAG TPA: YihY/virulence factor BrkB family protein [Allosphingosinicella sp.]|nr:YihY/virulence factor BrkB family protein [Allosphingosinicella sp.]
MAIQPVRWPATSEWRDVLVRTWKEGSDDNVGFLAAGVAFYGFLAFVPLLASAVLIYGLAADPQTVAEHIGKLFATLPRDAASLIADQLKSLTASPKSSKGFGLAVALLLAIYGASKGASGIVTALNIAYEVKETRSFIRTTLLSLAMTLGGLLVMLLAVTVISLTAAVESLLPGASPVVHVLAQFLLWGVALALVSVALALAYRYAPNRPDAPWRWITPGSAAASLLWLLASLGFGLYVSHFGNYNATYGSLGGVIVFLTWLYLSAYILLMGGELNSELEKAQDAEEEKNKAPAPQPIRSLTSRTDAAPAAPSAHRPRFGKAALAAGGVLGLFLWGRRRGNAERIYAPEQLAPRTIKP